MGKINLSYLTSALSMRPCKHAMAVRRHGICCFHWDGSRTHYVGHYAPVSLWCHFGGIPHPFHSSPVPFLTHSSPVAPLWWEPQRRNSMTASFHPGFWARSWVMRHQLSKHSLKGATLWHPYYTRHMKDISHNPTHQLGLLIKIEEKRWGKD